MANRVAGIVGRAIAAIFVVAACGLNGARSLAQTNPASTPVQQLPTLGDASELGSSAERRLGDRVARELYRDPDYIDDPVLDEYVQNIWQPLLQAARRRGDLTPELEQRFAWKILMGRDRSVNAFALPGGYFGLHLGLLAIVGTRDELASVLGHELSHVTQRHISRLLSKQTQQLPWMIGGVLLGALAAGKSPDAANALIVGGQAVAAQNQLNFSRDMEREADRVGLGIMTQAGFDAHGFTGMFDKLQLGARFNDQGAYPYLRSHPLTSERIADMQARQGVNTPEHAQQTAQDAMISARARVLTNPGVDTLRAMVSQADGAVLTTEPAARYVGVLYGAALAAIRLRDFATTRQILARLQALVRSDAPSRRLVRLLEAELALAAGDATRVLTLLGEPAATSDGVAQTDTEQRRPELFLLAQAAIQTGQAAHATQLGQRLQLWLLTHQHDAQAWQLLAGADAAQNQTLRAIRAQAEALAAQLDYAGALDRLKAAQERLRENRAASGTPPAGDYIEASIIDTRRRQIELLLKEQPLDG